ncbi:MAG: exosortase-dependent surface protein XDP1 [Thiobacillaceae bacterium]
MNKTRIATLVGGAFLICGTEAHAVINWTYGGSSTSSTPGNTVTSTAGGVTATAQAWSNTNDGTPNDVGSGSAATAASYKLETAYLGVYSGGLGVNNQDGTSIGSATGDAGDLAGTAPEHAIDNNQRYDSVLFSFSGAAVNLTSMTTGYVSGDSDFTVWYYTGSGNPSLTLANGTYGNLGAGWNLLGSYNGGSTPGATLISNSAGIYSSYWLIGAFNNVADTSSTLSAGNDYFKISGLSGTQCTSANGCGPKGAPEPGTLFLMSAGLIGLTRIKRRHLFNNA